MGEGAAEEKAAGAPGGRCSCGSGRNATPCCEGERCRTRAEWLHGQGLAAFRSGKLEGALVLVGRSVVLAPGDAGFRVNLGVVFEARNELASAIAEYRRAAELAPGMYEAHLKVGNALLRRGALVEACVSLRRAIALRPRDSEAVNNLGVALGRMGRPDAAAVCYRQALAFEGGHAPAYSNLGALLETQGRSADAVACLEAAVACDPALGDGWSNLAASLRSLGRMDEAERCARRALELQPGDLEARLNLGNALKEQGRLELAAETYAAAALAALGDGRPWSNLGEVRRDQGRIAEAAKAYGRAVTEDSLCAAAWSNLIYLHGFAHDLGASEEVALARRWEIAMVPEAEREAARRAGSVREGVFRTGSRTGRRLRVGVVSAELGTHAVAEFVEPFLEELDRERFHLTLFPTMSRHCGRAERIRALADRVVPLTGLTDPAAVERVRAAGIDVLLDTSGHTAGNRLGVFARRAAPVQCTWIGYWGTTGLSEMDWFLTDQMTAPVGAEAGFSERVWRLRRHGLCYRGDRSLAIEWKPDAGGAIRLGSFNKFAKVREETIALWAGALRAVPEARVVLEDRGTDESESHRRIQDGLARHGIAAERVEFVPYAPGHERHMGLYNGIDIALDAVPFNSGTTGFDALWMGVPLVTVAGNWLGGQIAGGVLEALGRREWIARDAGDFARIVRELARDVGLRRRVRERQRAEMAAGQLGDARGLARAVEEAFCGMYDDWLAGGRQREVPGAFRVPSAAGDPQRMKE